MKILALDGDAFLARLGLNEIAQLRGYRSPTAMRKAEPDLDPIGLTIDVKARLDEIGAGMVDAKKIRGVRDRLAGNLGRLDAVLEALAPPEPAPEPEGPPAPEPEGPPGDGGQS